ncbi:unnamed protein product [Rotaria magnacalcarata]|uniref:F-box domain-containing protein n=1 Tax=Rotaria magnacalcarata TaxID=392030 RepID=A0A816L8B7_9BILA|nr:unnamed protein product [Rotaria magnacalcarata]CAF2122311.1 unnamed protein product [Rotaria magnacalcarata]
MGDTERVPSLDTLPAELLYQLLDLLPCENILISVANVCRRFRSIAHAYDRYDIDLRSISKPTFHKICRSIRPVKVISLTLSDDEKTPGQIGLFLSVFHIKLFRRLRHLTLINVAAKDLMTISSQCQLNSLISFTMDARGQHIISPLKMITRAIALPSLCKLSLTSIGCIFDRISWPTDCLLQNLKIQTCTCQQFLTLLSRLPHLKTLDIALYEFRSTDARSTTIHRSLTSLTMSIGHTHITSLDSLLLLTPSLVNLKLIINSCDAEFLSQCFSWEEFIQHRLTELQKFEFFFTVCHHRQDSLFDIETLIDSFRRPFWLEDKRWLVCCEQTKSSKYRTYLYTVPMCISRFKYLKPFRKIFSTVDNLPSNTTCRVSTLIVDLTTRLMSSLFKRDDPNSTTVEFGQVTDLVLFVYGEQIRESMKFASTLIDVSQLQHLSISLYSDIKMDDDPTVYVSTLLKSVRNLRSLAINFCWPCNKYSDNLKSIISMVPRHVHHLQIDARSAKLIKEVFEQIVNLSSVAFRIRGYQPLQSEDILAWLTKRCSDFTFVNTRDTLNVWLGKMEPEPNELLSPNKRLKIND